MFSNELIINTLIYIKNNIFQKIKIKDLEKELNYNRSYLMRLFKKELGISIINYINTCKVSKSLDMLINSDNSILKIALLSGFNSLEYYSEIFKKIVGYSPQQFKKYLNDDNNKQIVIDKLINLKEFNDRIDYYIRNKKPQCMSKVKKI